MLRRDRFASRIEREHLIGIDRQIPITRIISDDSDMPTSKFIRIMPAPDLPNIPIIKTEGEGFQKVEGIGIGGGGQYQKSLDSLNLKSMSLYILIGAVCLVGFIAFRRR